MAREADRQKVVNALKAAGDGSLLRGWRLEVDPDGSLDITFLDFCKAAQRLNITVNCELLFGVDTPNALSLGELAPQEGELVFRFRSWMTHNFGGPGEMFLIMEEQDSCEGRLSRQQFITGCLSAHFDGTQEELGELFNLLDVSCLGSVAMEDVMFLDLDPKRREGAVKKAKMRNIIEHEHLLTELYRDMTKEARPKGHRLAPRGWLAPDVEKLPEVIIEKRLKWRCREILRRGEVLEAFKTHLEKTWGNGVRAWRRGLDTGTRFKVTKGDIASYCRRLNLEVDVGCLWGLIDKDADGILSLEEVAPQAAAALAPFWKWARDSWGSCAKAWAPIMGAARPPSSWKSLSSLRFSTFLKALEALEWPGIDEGLGSALVMALDLNGCGIVSKSDLIWLDKWDAPEWLCCEADPEAWAELSRLMLKTYRKPLKAWRSMDVDDSNVVSWVEFQAACNKVGFRGNRGGAWRTLDADTSGMISMDEWHPESAALLKSFKEWIDKHFGSVQYAFKIMDSDNSGSLSFSELKRQCRRLGWPGDCRLIFECLNVDIKPGQRTLSYKHLAFLDNWDPNVQIQYGNAVQLPGSRPSTAGRPSSVGQNRRSVAEPRRSVAPRTWNSAKEPSPRPYLTLPEAQVTSPMIRRSSSAPGGAISDYHDVGLPFVMPQAAPVPRHRPSVMPRRAFGVGCLRAETLQSMQLELTRLKDINAQLQMETQELRQLAKAEWSPQLPRLDTTSGPRPLSTAQEEDDEDDDSEVWGDDAHHSVASKDSKDSSKFSSKHSKDRFPSKESRGRVAAAAA